MIITYFVGTTFVVIASIFGILLFINKKFPAIEATEIQEPFLLILLAIMGIFLMIIANLVKPVKK